MLPLLGNGIPSLMWYTADTICHLIPKYPSYNNNLSQSDMPSGVMHDVSRPVLLSTLTAALYTLFIGARSFRDLNTSDCYQAMVYSPHSRTVSHSRLPTPEDNGSLPYIRAIIKVCRMPPGSQHYSNF